jgi:DNA-binding NarL/FixJ family response regulator
LVDDRDLIRSMLRDVLTGFDCVFSEAEDGARALELIESNAFDVIVLDLKLPDRSGFDVLIEARERGMTLGKVIVLTGLPEAKVEKKAFSLGAFRFLSKGAMSWSGIRRAFQDAIGVAPAAIVPTVRTRSSRARKRLSADHASRESVLVVDSDPASLDAMLDILGEEFTPTPAKNADDAFRKLARLSPALVVIDVKLAGGVSGLDLLTRMRKSVPDLRAIMISDERDPEAAFESAQRGALKYVLKERLVTLPTAIKRILNDRRPPTKVFLCYAKSDVARVSSVHKRLVKRGFLPWMDEKSLRGGDDWELELKKAIEETHYFVFFLSANSVGREGVMRLEVNLALRRVDKKLIGARFFVPARLEKCSIDPSIRRFHYVDVFGRNGFTDLVNALSPSK